MSSDLNIVKSNFPKGTEAFASAVSTSTQPRRSYISGKFVQSWVDLPHCRMRCLAPKTSCRIHVLRNHGRWQSSNKAEYALPNRWRHTRPCPWFRSLQSLSNSFQLLNSRKARWVFGVCGPSQATTDFALRNMVNMCCTWSDFSLSSCWQIQRASIQRWRGASGYWRCLTADARFCVIGTVWPSRCNAWSKIGSPQQ